jgi:hypothetical protein
MHAHPTILTEAVTLYQRGVEGRRDAKARDGAFSVLLDEFLDAFYTETDPAQRQAMIDEEPPRIGEERRDAYVGAVGEHLARRWGLQIPRWSIASWRGVAEPWFVGRMGIGLSGLLLVESLIAFRRRRIFTEAEPLRRARIPVAQSIRISNRCGKPEPSFVHTVGLRRRYKSLTSRNAS